MTQQLPETGFLRLPQIVGNLKRGIPPLLPICKTSWWQGVKEGRYPKGIKLSGGVTVWRVNDIRDLIARIGEQSNAESPAKRQRRGRKTTQEVS